MFTSGTTGLPKCMVQSAGGILIHHLKELVLHTNLTREDTIFYFTTCGWMMWNWLVSSLAVGAKLLLFDGNPFYPHPGVLWRTAQDEGITVFGTSAGYISALMNEGVRPGKEYDLSALKAILSTGSPLSEEGFEFIYREIKADLQLSSISGGSDINGCFALGNPMGPVYSGELQCRGLGMKVEAFDENGKPVINRQGELVCSAPAPSMPIYFWDDPGNKKYRAAYFDVYPNVWRHGDYILINERGGVVIYGRSDATLNPGGVRIGTAEIYRQVENIEGIARQHRRGAELEERRPRHPLRQDGAGKGTDRRAPGPDPQDDPRERIPAPRSGQDHRRTGYSLYPEHEEGRAFGEEGHRRADCPEQGRPQESGVSRLLCEDQRIRERMKDKNRSDRHL